MARIALDMDGSVTEGRYLPAPRTRAAYMSLAPYDNDTIDILTDICREHEVYIITARSEPYGHRNIVDWFNRYAYYDKIKPAGILTCIEQQYKYGLAQTLGCNLMFDDSPIVWDTYRMDFARYPSLWLMDNPHWDKNQSIATPCRLRSWKEVLKVINETINNKTTHA